MLFLKGESLSFQYGDQTPVFTNLSYEVKSGDFILLTGANGAGKSTLLKLMLGQLKPSEGTCTRQGTISYVAQNSLIDVAHFPATVMEVMLTGLYKRKMKKADKKMAVLKELDYLGLPGLENRRLSALSGGQKQRVLLGRALLEHPDLLVLDEPLNGIDEASCQRLEFLLKQASQRETAILMVSHRWKLDKTLFTAHWKLESGVLETC